MLEGFALSPAEWSTSALVSLAVLSLIFGWLVPRSTLLAERKDKEYWRGIALKGMEVNAVNANSISEIAEGSKTTMHVMDAVQQQIPTQEGESA